MKAKIILVGLMVVMFGCSKDDGPESPDPYILEAIVGSWAYDTVKINGTLYQYSHTEGCVKDLFQFFNQEGKLFDFEEEVVLNCANCAECALGSTNLRWHLRGNIVDLFFGEQLVVKLRILEVNDSLIRYVSNFDYDGDGDLDEVEITGLPYDPYDEFN
jgi:hypothetical protein